VFNLSLYDCHLVLTRAGTGEKIWQQTVGKYHDPNFPGQHLGSNPRMKRPGLSQIPRIESKGIYALACTRHPWQRAHAVLWDSPYITVSTGDTDRLHRFPDRAGEFEIKGIPEGRHTVEVWHPRFEPVKKTYEVDISMDQTTPLSIEFKAPAILKATPALLPDRTITQWAFAGPFDPLMDEEPDAPNNNLDFSATYEGMEGEVSWKRVKAAAGRDKGYVLLDKAMWKIHDLCLSYFAVRIDSAKPQRLQLQVHNQTDSLKVWLNRKVIFRSYTGDFGAYARYPRPFIITGDLKAGKNTLLLLVSMERTVGARLSVKYRGEGVRVVVPLK